MRHMLFALFRGVPPTVHRWLRCRHARADFGLAYPFNPKHLPVKGLKLEGTPWCAPTCSTSLSQQQQTAQAYTGTNMHMQHAEDGLCHKTASVCLSPVKNALESLCLGRQAACCLHREPQLTQCMAEHSFESSITYCESETQLHVWQQVSGAGGVQRARPAACNRRVGRGRHGTQNVLLASMVACFPGFLLPSPMPPQPC